MEDARLLPDIWTVILAFIPSPYTRGRLARVCRAFATIVGLVHYPPVRVGRALPGYTKVVVDPSWDITTRFVLLNGVPFACHVQRLERPSSILLTRYQRDELARTRGLVDGHVNMRPCDPEPPLCFAACIKVCFARARSTRALRVPAFSRHGLRTLLADGLLLWPAREHVVRVFDFDVYLKVQTGNGVMTSDTTVEFVSTPQSGIKFGV